VARRRFSVCSGVVTVALLAVTALPACSNDRAPTTDPGTAPAGAEPTGTGPADAGVRFTRIGRLGTMATAVAADPDGEVVYVGERNGLVHAMRWRDVSGARVPAFHDDPALDLRADTSVDGERGLLGLAVVDGGRRLLVSHTTPAGDLRVLAYDDIAADGFRRDPLVLLDVPHPTTHHIGGALLTLPSGDVLVSVGDMGWLNPPYAQEVDGPYGKILRIPSAAAAGSALLAARDLERVAYGLRNPWRISLDRVRGDLWLGDVGNDRFEEVDVLRAGALGAPADNFGWPYVEGDQPFRPPATAPSPTGLVAPVAIRPHAPDTCAVIGGVVYRGSRLPPLAGRYLFGDFCGRDLLSLDAARPDGAPHTEGRLPASPVNFAELADGEVWITTADGGVYRVDPGWWDVADSDARAPEPAGPTTTVPDATVASACRFLDVLTSLADLETMAPADAEARVEEAITLLDGVDTATPSLAADVEVVRGAFEETRSLGVASGWRLGTDEFAEFKVDLFAADGAHPAFGGAYARVLEAITRSCRPGDG